MYNSSGNGLQRENDGLYQRFCLSESDPETDRCDQGLGIRRSGVLPDHYRLIRGPTGSLPYTVKCHLVMRETTMMMMMFITITDLVDPL